jgi:hypothetical protein
MPSSSMCSSIKHLAAAMQRFSIQSMDVVKCTSRPDTDRWLLWVGGVLLLFPASALVSWLLLLVVEVILVGVLVTEVQSFVSAGPACSCTLPIWNAERLLRSLDFDGESILGSINVPAIITKSAFDLAAYATSFPTAFTHC